MTPARAVHIACLVAISNSCGDPTGDTTGDSPTGETMGTGPTALGDAIGVEGPDTGADLNATCIQRNQKRGSTKSRNDNGKSFD